MSEYEARISSHAGGVFVRVVDSGVWRDSIKPQASSGGLNHPSIINRQLQSARAQSMGQLGQSVALDTGKTVCPTSECPGDLSFSAHCGLTYLHYRPGDGRDEINKSSLASPAASPV